MKDTEEIEEYTHDYFLNRPYVFILVVGVTIAVIIDKT